MFFKIKYSIFVLLIKLGTSLNFFKHLLNNLRKLFIIFWPKYFLGNSFKYQRIYHFHIQKTAGTSLNSAFYHASGINFEEEILKQFSNIFTRSIRINDKIFSDHNISIINKGAYFYSWSHYPFEDIEVDSDTFTFTSIRDPQSRLISYYNFLTDIKNNHFLSKYKHMNHLLNHYEDDFETFLHKLPDKNRYAQLYMFSKDLNFEKAKENIKKVNFIIINENFEYFVNEVSKQFNLHLEIQKKNVSENKLDNSINLKNYLEKEYDFYNYVLNHLELKSGTIID